MVNSRQPDYSRARMDFAAWLVRVCGRSAATASAYERDARAYRDWAAAQDLSLEAALSRPQLGLYLLERMQDKKRWAGEQQQLGARSAARIVSALRMYQGWLRFNGELAAAAGFEPEPPQYSRRLPDYYNTAEMSALVAAWDGDPAPLSLRNAAMLHLLYATGIRASELCGLDLGDLEPRARLLRVRGKGNRERVVPYGQKAAAALELWLQQGRPLLDGGTASAVHSPRTPVPPGRGGTASAVHSPRTPVPPGRGGTASAVHSPLTPVPPGSKNYGVAAAPPPPGSKQRGDASSPSSPIPHSTLQPETGNLKPLFLNHRGGRLTRRGLHNVVDRSALRAGLIKPLSAHKLRHACATHLLEGGADVRLVQELLGHQSLNTTQVYTQITRTQLLEAYDKSHPRAKK